MKYLLLIFLASCVTPTIKDCPSKDEQCQDWIAALSICKYDLDKAKLKNIEAGLKKKRF
jgi:hypothetical protein